MVYESDFYTTRRYRPSSYSVTTPRHYMVVDREPVRREQLYQYSYTNTSETRDGAGAAAPQRTSYTSTTESRTGAGPGGYTYRSERETRGGPAGYSYSSTSSGRLPHGTTYRHYSYRV